MDAGQPGSSSTTSEIALPWPVTRLMTPGGMPDSSSRRIVTSAERLCVIDGFQMTVLPMSAGAVGRFPAMDVKLKGVIA